MQTDSLTLFELFVELVCAAAEQTPEMPNVQNLNEDNSFFCNIEDNMIQNTSMLDLLQGHDNILKTLAENWKKETDKPWNMLVQIDEFIIENKEYFKRSKIEVRTILDYVYTVV